MRFARRAALTCAALVVAACTTSSSKQADASGAPQAASGFRAGLTVTSAEQHMAASANPLATEAGREMLRTGGSAIDAAIAIQMVLTLVEPQSSGIGGGAMMLHWDGKRVQAFDGQETAPLAADEYLFMAGAKPMAFHDAAVGGRSVGTPGALRMLEAAHKQHGKLRWAQLFEPAIRLAENGFVVSPRLNTSLANERHLAKDSAARVYFYNADGTPKPVGAVLKNPDLAQTLRTIATNGPDAFYKGAIVGDIVRKVQTHPNAGRLAESDFASYQARERTPLCTDYKSWRVCGMPPPSSGGIAVTQMLGIFANRNISVVPPNPVEGNLEPQADAVHLFSEAARLAYADRSLYVADPDFVPVDMLALTHPAYLAERARLITDRSMGRMQPGIPAGYKVVFAPDNSPPRVSTSHISVVDKYGNAVSMTTSIESQFGARMMVRGFLLNSQLTDFSFAPSEGGRPIANRVQAGKRPRSAMAPTLVFDRASHELVATLGSPGGSQIIGYVAKTLVATLEWNLDIQQAISLPNFGSRNGPTELERGRFSPSVINGLKARGHEVSEIDMTSGLQGIVRVTLSNGRPGWAGGADPRREGIALGD
jgi:gamma-glutamyltranspeptidase / glutathione hydrolase